MRWIKDLCVVRRAEGKYEQAFDLCASIFTKRLDFDGRFRGKLEHNHARSLQTLGRRHEALRHYSASGDFHRAAGTEMLLGMTEMDAGRCLVEMGEPSQAYPFFDRAEESADSHLRGLIFESRALALLAEGRVDEALTAVAESIGLLARGDDEVNLAESLKTRSLIRGRQR